MKFILFALFNAQNPSKKNIYVNKLKEFFSFNKLFDRKLIPIISFLFFVLLSSFNPLMVVDVSET